MPRVAAKKTGKAKTPKAAKAAAAAAAPEPVAPPPAPEPMFPPMEEMTPPAPEAPESRPAPSSAELRPPTTPVETPVGEPPAEAPAEPAPVQAPETVPAPEPEPVAPSRPMSPEIERRLREQALPLEEFVMPVGPSIDFVHDVGLPQPGPEIPEIQPPQETTPYQPFWFPGGGGTTINPTTGPAIVPPVTPTSCGGSAAPCRASTAATSRIGRHRITAAPSRP